MPGGSRSTAPSSFPGLECMAQVVVGLRESVSKPMPGGSRRLSHPVFLGAGMRLPSCCAPRGGPVAIPIAPAQALDGVVQFPLSLEKRRPVAMRLGMVRFQFQNPAVGGDRLVQLPQGLQSSAQSLFTSTSSGASSILASRKPRLRSFP